MVTLYREDREGLVPGAPPLRFLQGWASMLLTQI